MENKPRLVVLGGGESGVGAAILGLDKGWDVFLSDNGPIAQRYKEQLDREGIAWEENGHTESLILSATEVNKMPRLPPTAPIVVKLTAKGTPVISEIEFAGPLHRRQDGVHNRQQRQDNDHHAHLPHTARSRTRRGHSRQRGPQPRTAGGTRQPQHICGGTQQLPAREHVPVQGQHSRDAQHHPRPPRPLRLSDAELYQRQVPHNPQHAAHRRLHLLAGRSGDRGSVAPGGHRSAARARLPSTPRRAPRHISTPKTNW